MATNIRELAESINQYKRELWVVSWWVAESEPDKARFHFETLAEYMDASLRRLVDNIDPGYELIAILDSMDSASNLVNQLSLRTD